MLLRASMRQARRAPVRMILCFALMALVCAFLTLGLNLRASTEQNLESIYDSYEVIAVPSGAVMIACHSGQTSSSRRRIQGRTPTPTLPSSWCT